MNASGISYLQLWKLSWIKNCEKKTSKCQVLAWAQNPANPLWRMQVELTEVERPHKKMSKRHLIKTGLQCDTPPPTPLHHRLTLVIDDYWNFGGFRFFLASFFAWLKGVAAWVKWGYVICQFVSPKLATNACPSCFFCCCCSCLQQKLNKVIRVKPQPQLPPSVDLWEAPINKPYDNAVKAFPACHNFQSH